MNSIPKTRVGRPSVKPSTPLNPKLIALGAFGVILAVFGIMFFVSKKAKTSKEFEVKEKELKTKIVRNLNPYAEIDEATGDVVKMPPKTPKPRVFHVKNLYTYKDASKVCKKYGSQLASFKQLIDSYYQGANWESYGWLEGQYIARPVQNSFSKQYNEDTTDLKFRKTVKPDIQWKYEPNKNMEYGVNCYGSYRSPEDDEAFRKMADSNYYSLMGAGATGGEDDSWISKTKDTILPFVNNRL